MKWNVSNAISRDVERQQLNRILAEIREAVDARSSITSSGASIQDTVGKMVENNSEKGIAVTYNYGSKLLDFAVSDFIIRLSGDITGEGEVIGLNAVTINTTLDPALVGVPEAPVDNNFYWRWNGEWAQVGNSLINLSATRGVGFAAGHKNTDGDERWDFRQFEAAVGELTLANADGSGGNPQYGLADLTDSGVGVSTVKLITRDAKGRVSGTQDASTTNLPEGANLYFTDERAQDAVGSALTDSIGVKWVYDDAANAIIANATGSTYASVLNTEAVAVQPGTPVSLVAASSVVRADKTVVARDFVGLVADTAIGAGGNGFIVSDGELTLTEVQWDDVIGATGGLVPAKDYYLSGLGTISHVPPSPTAGNYSCKIGKSISTTTLLIEPHVAYEL